MRHLFFVGLMAVAACGSDETTSSNAGSTTAGEGGASAAGGSPASGGAAGVGGEGSTSTATGATSTTATAGATVGTASAASTGSGDTCSEAPCKLVAPQCGCDEGEACTIFAGAFPGEEVGCAPPGPVLPGEQCSGGAGSCVAGAICLYVEEGEGEQRCHRFCDDDAQCVEGPGSFCEIGGFSGPQSNVLACSDSCDPLTSAGCGPEWVKCGVFEAFRGDHVYTRCIGAGSGVAGDYCDDDTTHCAAGLDCREVVEDGLVATKCLQVCSEAEPACSEGLTCRLDTDPASTIGGVDFGVCAP